MIELMPADNDDAHFLALAQRIVNGAVAALQRREVYLVHVDNWFDHKWLGWRSRGKHKKLLELRVPLFTPNRIRSEKHIVLDEETSTWTWVAMPNPLHRQQPGRPSLAERLDRFSKSAAFVWYSGNTATNKVGSLMLYLSDADKYAWYASFKKDGPWAVNDEFRITRRELAHFEERGRQMELVQA
jgi:hypothetical protein